MSITVATKPVPSGSHAWIVTLSKSCYRAVMTLNPKQQRFCEEYIITLNATDAAKKAGYSEKGASVTAAKLLALPKIAKYVEKLNATRAKRVKIEQDDVIREIAKIAFSNITDAVTWNESGVIVKDSSLLTPEQSAAIAEVSETRGKYGPSIKVKMYDKKGALELLGRHLSMFSDNVKVSTPEGESIKVEPVTPEDAARWYAEKMRKAG